MTSTSTPIKDNSIWIFISLLATVLLSGILFGPCKGSVDRPTSIPKDANYDKKTNHYQLTSEGLFREWYENGNLVTTVPVNSVGQLDGFATKFNYLNGITTMQGKMVNGERDGLWKFYFSDGKLYIEQNYKAGYRKKQIWFQTSAIGNENGAYFRYFRNGRLNEKGFYDGGLRTGDWVRYYPDTRVETKGSYLEDKKVGEWFYYYPNGVKEASELYSESGELLARYTYYPNGSIWCVVKKNQTPDCK